MLVLTLNRGERLKFIAGSGETFYVSLNQKSKKSPKSVSVVMDLPDSVRVEREPAPEGEGK